MKRGKGFYDEDGNYAKNSVTGDGFEILKKDHKKLTYPIHGWTWREEDPNPINEALSSVIDAIKIVPSDNLDIQGKELLLNQRNEIHRLLGEPEVEEYGM